MAKRVTNWGLVETTDGADDSRDLVIMDDRGPEMHRLIVPGPSADRGTSLACYDIPRPLDVYLDLVFMMGYRRAQRHMKEAIGVTS